MLLNTIRRVIADPQWIDLVRLILESHAENEVREHFRPSAVPRIRDYSDSSCAAECLPPGGSRPDEA